MLSLKRQSIQSEPISPPPKMINQTLVDSLYVLQNRNGTVDTISCPSSEAAKWYAETTGAFQGGNKNVVQVSTLSGLDLVASELKFDYHQSLN